MKKILLGTVGLLALAASVPASAADLRPRTYTKAPAVSYVQPIYDWTGFYLGAQIGGQWGNDNYGLNSDGFIGGVHAGYNFQAGSLVYGIEGDFEGSGQKDSVALSPTATENFRNRWQGSIRGRLGWAASNQILLYGTAGVAFADNRYTILTTTPASESFRGHQTGWTVGAGLEYMFAPAWSARAEYRYTDFGSKTYFPIDAGAPAAVVADPSNHSVRVGVSYHWGGPVVAKY